MNIGIIGSGRIGGTVGRFWAYAGHQVMFSGRDQQKARTFAASVGPNARAGSPAEAARFGEVILFAPPWTQVDAALREAGNHLRGRTLIDTTNPFGPSGVEDLGPDNSAGQEVARRAAGAHVVKAYNTLPADVLATSNREARAEQLALFLCGDGAEAKQVVAALIRDSGYLPLDTGPLAFARYQEPNGPLFNKPLHEADARKLLDALPEP